MSCRDIFLHPALCNRIVVLHFWRITWEKKLDWNYFLNFSLRRTSALKEGALSLVISEPWLIYLCNVMEIFQSFCYIYLEMSKCIYIQFIATVTSNVHFGSFSSNDGQRVHNGTGVHYMNTFENKHEIRTLLSFCFAFLLSTESRSNFWWILKSKVTQLDGTGNR